MEIAHCEVFFRGGKGSATIDTENRGSRLRFFRRRQMGNRLRGSWAIAVAHRRNAKAYDPIRNLGFPLGHRFPAV